MWIWRWGHVRSSVCVVCRPWWIAAWVCLWGHVRSPGNVWCLVTGVHERDELRIYKIMKTNMTQSHTAKKNENIYKRTEKWWTKVGRKKNTLGKEKKKNDWRSWGDGTRRSFMEVLSVGCVPVLNDMSLCPWMKCPWTMCLWMMCPCVMKAVSLNDVTLYWMMLGVWSSRHVRLVE